MYGIVCRLSTLYPAKAGYSFEMSRTKKRGRGRPSKMPKLKVIWEYVPGPESKERLTGALRMLFAEQLELPEPPKSRQLKLY